MSPEIKISQDVITGKTSAYDIAPAEGGSLVNGLFYPISLEKIVATNEAALIGNTAITHVTSVGELTIVSPNASFIPESDNVILAKDPKDLTQPMPEPRLPHDFYSTLVSADRKNTTIHIEDTDDEDQVEPYTIPEYIDDDIQARNVANGNFVHPFMPVTIKPRNTTR